VPAHPMLTTTRLLLRSFTLVDAPDVHLLAGAREAASTTLHIPHPYTRAMAVEWISTSAESYAHGVLVNFAIVRRLDQVLMGCVGLDIDPQHANAELGYWLGIPFWGSGYGTEAARAVLQHGFETLLLHRIHAAHMTRNPASGRILQKIGMTYEGCLRQQIRKWGVFEDIALYGMLDQEYAQERSHDTAALSVDRRPL